MAFIWSYMFKSWLQVGNHPPAKSKESEDEKTQVTLFLAI